MLLVGRVTVRVVAQVRLSFEMVRVCELYSGTQKLLQEIIMIDFRGDSISIYPHFLKNLRIAQK